MRVNLLNSLLVSLVFVSCLNTKTTGSKDIILEIEKTPCFGTCPVYVLSIYKDRTAILNAQQNLSLIGRYRSNLSDSRYEELISKFRESDFFEFENSYTSNATDLPTTYVTFNYEDNSKRIMDYDKAPKELRVLESVLHELIDHLDWTEVQN